MNLILEPGKPEHAQNICDLVNIAYRGNCGWSKESDLVAGNRTNTNEIKNIISNIDSHLLVAIYKGQVIACIHIEKNENVAYIGLFAVHPRFQNTGTGKEILIQAESYASVNLNVNKCIMVVISQRIELISYYERRGYKRIGNIQKYPTHLNVGVPLKCGLTIEHLEKNV